jgi:hypothetical protein
MTNHYLPVVSLAAVALVLACGGDLDSHMGKILLDQDGQLWEVEHGTNGGDELWKVAPR